MPVITDYKPIGITCGDFIKKYPDKEIAYVGRLDPMAHGLITILTGKDVKDMEHYQKKAKIYKFKFIMGMNTDTDDILGIQTINNKEDQTNLETIIEFVNNFPNEYNQKYHSFSSFKPAKRNNDGKRKPLWWWVVNNYIIDEIPEKKVKIYEKKISKIELRDGEDIRAEFLAKIAKIEDNKFRKEETILQWKEMNFGYKYNEITCTFSVSSGFYIRQFVRDMSDILNVKIIVTDIERINIF
jgi:tRNA U55 pseudouridine synthase TruB